MKANQKVSFRLFKKHIIRLITIVAIVLVSVGFMAGLGEVENTIKDVLNEYYISQNISDLYIKSSNMYGFSPKQLNDISTVFAEENIMKTFCYETKIDDEIFRVYAYDLNNQNINKLELLSGKLPSSNNEIVVERKTTTIKGFEIGDTVTLQNQDYTVCGIVLNPLIINEAEEPSFQFEEEHLHNVVYLNTSTLPIVNDVYITFSNRSLFDNFSDEYEVEVNKYKETLSSTLGESASVLSLYENVGIFSLVSYAEKVGLIAIIFVIFFLLVTLLVVYSTMSRLLDEERGQIACLKTLGYKNFSILSKYLLFVFIGVVIGSIFAFAVSIGLTWVIYSAFNMQYAMPEYAISVRCSYFFLSFGIILISSLLLIIITGWRNIRQKPVVLLTPKTPKKGRKVLIEHIPFIWNKLSFKYKSTVRNVFLFRSRFHMTVISIVGSTILMLAGMGLLDCALKLDNGESIAAISTALIIFSAVLCALVIYNLTNINISERNREIATLMVLGYTNREVSGYIFREIYIMSAVGAVLGVPLGLGFITFVFELIDFGALQDINWWTWILAPAATMLFSFLSTKLLQRKITKTDMNASLKILE